MAGISPKSRLGSGCLIVFGAVFFIAGMVPGFFAVASVIDWYEAQDWTPVDARISAADLERGDDTWRVTARYHYRFNGVEYDGDRVAFHGGSDNIGDFHRTTHARLQEHLRNKRPLTVYVDPRNPADAVIVRDMRWGLFGFLMIFPLVFGAAGAGIIGFSVYGGRRLARQNQREQMYPAEPWRWNADWQDGVVRGDTSKALWFAGFFATVWNLISLPLPVLLWDDVVHHGNYAALLGLLFPAVGVALIAWVVRLVLQQRRYGDASFTLDTFPAVPGGQLAGKLHIPASLPVNSILNARLSCIHEQTTGSGKNRTTREHFLWQDEQRLRIQPHHVFEGTRLHVVFPVPADQPPTDDTGPASRILWRLAFSADVPGLDFSTTLEVPVFHTGTKPVMPSAATAVSDAAEAPDWRRTGVLARQLPEGMELVFPSARHKGMAVMLTVITAIFGAATVFLASEGEVFMAVVFGGFSLLLLWGSLHGWLRRSRLMLSDGSLWVQTGHLWWSKPTRWLAHAIRDLRVQSTTRVGNTRYYDRSALTAGGNAIRLASSLAGRRDTAARAGMIADRLGVEWEG